MLEFAAAGTRQGWARERFNRARVHFSHSIFRTPGFYGRSDILQAQLNSAKKKEGEGEFDYGARIAAEVSAGMPVSMKLPWKDCRVDARL